MKLLKDITMISLIISIAIAASEPSNFQMDRLICNDRVVAEYIVDRRTTRWEYINESWVLMQYMQDYRYNLAEHIPKLNEQCHAVYSD